MPLCLNRTIHRYGPGGEAFHVARDLRHCNEEREVLVNPYHPLHGGVRGSLHSHRNHGILYNWDS